MCVSVHVCTLYVSVCVYVCGLCVYVSVCYGLCVYVCLWLCLCLCVCVHNILMSALGHLGDRAFQDRLKAGLCYLKSLFYRPRGGGALLITGPSGSDAGMASRCGKTSLAKLLCKAVRGAPYYAHCIIINCTTLRGKGKCVCVWGGGCI